jgi:multidrug efflux pump subunit AcrA (membrane-fusion protein)
VPISAVFRGDGDSKVVYVRNGSATERRKVSVGVTNFDYAEIKDGVREGETVFLVEPRRPSEQEGAVAKAGSGRQRSS